MATKDLHLGQAADVSIALPVANRKALGIGSLFVGLAFIYLVGFAPMMTVHNAAHDTRHTSAFPCH